MRRPGWIAAFFLSASLLIVWGCHPSAAGTAGRPSFAATGSGSAPVPSLTVFHTPNTDAASGTRKPPAGPSPTDRYSSGATPTACEPNPRYGVDGRRLPAPTLPAKAAVQMRGRRQSLPLDCESRSAVDWAAYFGVAIDELAFFNKLPTSDNPDEGFVGSVYGSWGNLPPHAYGVHAGPVALLLRSYGLEAYAYRGMSWEQLRAELAAGRPAIVWVTGHVWKSAPVTMTVTSGANVLVARQEHTVILTGYTEKMATVLDGSTKYSVDIPSFAASWGVLGNMAVVGRILPARPDCAGSAVELVPRGR